MKKTLLLFCVVLFMDLSASWAQSDVTSEYLNNYWRPFTSTGESLITGTTRFQKIASPWIVEGGMGTMGTDYTSWHVDSDKMGCMTLTAGWDGFAASFDNMKVYQKVTLKAGVYTFLAELPFDVTASAKTFLVVNKGIGLPDTANVVNALAFSRLSVANSVLFTLDESMDVSLGVLAGFGDKQCIAIGGFTLSYQPATGICTFENGQKYVIRCHEGYIVVDGVADFDLYTLTGQKIPSSAKLKTGCYIVRVKDFATKVFVTN